LVTGAEKIRESCTILMLRAFSRPTEKSGLPRY
jgi:hypothetical protein